MYGYTYLDCWTTLWIGVKTRAGVEVTCLVCGNKKLQELFGPFARTTMKCERHAVAQRAPLSESLRVLETGNR